MTFTCTDGKLTIMLDERIDSMNSNAFDDELGKIVGGNAHKSLVLDAQNLSYISSAGLRVLLKYRKSLGGLALNNVSDEIYEIFEVTGFSDILEISRKSK
ncbi:MAG: STAS domain-containing protein [Lachnospiraceae bacterium]|nr:STAS domain-containing protein [Lachnospiraceae bacterium]